MSSNHNEKYSNFAIRLLELEQRFESYCTLYEEEMKEIRSTLTEMREELLNQIHQMEVEKQINDQGRIPDMDTISEGSNENEPLLAL
ncbi:MAG: hypothetical protein JXA42_16415 [Anaerolineales bacterium]|nr:hypothetical protein [Anaerolineales bacterium]